jgi:D-alanyl-D-alanine carboxypeptidase/D-alanyl-D-alanine-endopeptidase (penicillin-binding protein 4)
MILPLLVVGVLGAPSAAPANARDIALLQKTIERVAAGFPMNTAQLGVVVEEAATGRRLVMRQAKHEFAPASNFKLLDAATALAYLGPKFRFTTWLLARGPITAGTLDGDLIIVGGGDPVLARHDLLDAAAAVSADGIRRVAGSLLVDGSIFDGQRFGSGWAWDDMPYYYQPPIEALSVDEGTVRVTVAPGVRVADPVSATLEKDPGSMSVVSKAVTTPARGLDDVDCFRTPGSLVIDIVGHVPLGKKPDTFRCAVEDANDDAAAVLLQMLHDEGVAVGATALGTAPDNQARDYPDAGPAPKPADQRYPGASVLWKHESPALPELFRRMMPPSDNFIAEHLFKMLPVAALGRRGSFDGGAQVERRFIGWLGLDPGSLDNGDGSGLSQGDRITPLDLAEVLRWETRGAGGGAFIHSLARAGLEGTVKKHLKGTDAVGRVLAKDGYIWHVSTISGYALTKRHGLMIFSIMFNDANGSLRPFLKAEDAIIQSIVDMP